MKYIADDSYSFDELKNTSLAEGLPVSQEVVGGGRLEKPSAPLASPARGGREAAAAPVQHTAAATDARALETVREQLKQVTRSPGNELRQRPLAINGVAYDPYDPPKLYVSRDGHREYRGGTKLSGAAASRGQEARARVGTATSNDRDVEYAERYWAKQSPQVRDARRNAMRESLRTDAAAGAISVFVARDGITEDDKAHLSAIRIEAAALGYDLGPFAFNKRAGTATATLRQTRP